MSDTKTITCPHCRKLNLITPAAPNETRQCLHCHRYFVPSRIPNRAAIASVICGLPVCIPFVGLPALLLGILGLQKARRSGIGGAKMAILGIALGSIGICLTPLMLTSLKDARDTANTVTCANYMDQIGGAFDFYARDHRGAYPPDLGTLIETTDITPTQFADPTGPLSAPTNVSRHQGAVWVNSNTDFIYTAPGLNTADVDYGYIVVYEKKSYIGNRLLVLYADGHCEALPLDVAHDLIARQKRDILLWTTKPTTKPAH